MNVALTELAPAKINLALHVTAQLDNGYHTLESLVVFAELGDGLSLSLADKDRLEIAGPFADALEPGQVNLVTRAIEAFRTQWPELMPAGVAISLEKNLPVSAGIGGGSADAAAALRLLHRVTGERVPFARLYEVAARLGADVPVCLASVPCLVEGVGDKIVPLESFPRLFAVMVNPLIPVPTAEIFRRLETRQNSPMPRLPDPLSHAALLGMWLGESRNDLEPPARVFAPQIGELIDSLGTQTGVIGARMSGSGGTVFGLFADEGLAHEAARTMRERYPGYWVASAPIGRPDTSHLAQ